MEQLSVRLRIVTPMFMGGADPKQPELRTASIKGVLRFWWRAMHPEWSQHDLLAKENAIFGGTGEKEGQSSVIFEISGDHELRKTKFSDISSQSQGRAYLGYGLGGTRRDPERTGIDAEQEVVLRLLFRKPEHMDHVLRSLSCLSHFGGLGSRSRRGYGSIVAVDSEPAHPILAGPPSSRDALANEIRTRMREWGLGTFSGLPQYTAFSQRTRVRVLSPKRDWKSAMDVIGTELNAYRSTMREARFKDDAALVGAFLRRGTEPSRAPSRAVFGLPHNYFFLPERQSVSVQPGQGSPGDRRASPLLIHFHLLENGSVVPVLTLLPAVLLPDGAKLSISVGGRTAQVAPSTDMGPIEGFIERFQDAVEVRP